MPPTCTFNPAQSLKSLIDDRNPLKLQMSVKEIQKRAFEGTVPISFEFENEQMPYVLDVPRIAPLGSFVYQKFSSLIGDHSPNLWFSVNNIPVKCYLPVGVTYDLYTLNLGNIELLSIHVHTSELPEKTVQRCETQSIADWIFCQSFKESVFLTSQNQTLLIESPNLHQRILKAVIDRNFEQYYELFEDHFSNLTSEMKYTPIKLFLKNGNHIHIFAENKDGLALKDVLKNDIATRVFTHGIELPLDSKIADIIPSLLYPDSFIYLTCE